MRPNLRDVIALVKNTGRNRVWFKMVGWQFCLLTNPSEGAVEVTIGSDVRKSVKKGLDALELQEVESRKAAREFAGIRGSDYPDSDG